MDLRKQFERELNNRVEKIPYQELADEEALNIWFEQFCNAPKIPSYWLYRLQYYSDEEYSQMMSVYPPNYELRQNMNAIKIEFDEKVKSKTLDDKFYINDITKTEIAEALNAIQEQWEMFLYCIYDNNPNKYKEYDLITENIINNLNKLNLDFASLIIENIKDGDNTSLQFAINQYDYREINDIQRQKLGSLKNVLIKSLTERKDKKEQLPVKNDTEIINSNSNIKVKENIRETLFDTIKDYINEQQHKQFLQLLGGLEINSKIVFRGKANQLVDIFKQLYDNSMITATTKKELNEWLVKNFNIEKTGNIKSLNFDTTKKSLTNLFYQCQTPIIEIKEGKIGKR